MELPQHISEEFHVLLDACSFGEAARERGTQLARYLLERGALFRVHVSRQSHDSHRGTPCHRVEPGQQLRQRSFYHLTGARAVYTA